MARRLVSFGRRLLSEPEKPIVTDWHTIEAGPASGCSVLLPVGGAISDAFVEGTYEAETMQVVQAIIAPHDTCWDIGGHYGYYTLSLAKLANQGHVHTFEPLSSHADRIEKAAAKSGLSNVTVHAVAMAGEAGTMSLRFSPSEGGDDSMAYLDRYGGVETEAATEHYSKFQSTEVATWTMDSAIAATGNPSFIKIDAEGAEIAIVGAAKELLATVRPILLIELHGINEALGCADVLCRNHYQAVLLTDQKTTLPVLWIPAEDETTIGKVSSALGRNPTQLFGDFSRSRSIQN